MGFDITEVDLTGGAAKNASIRQIIADIFNVKVHVLENSGDPVSIGMALNAGKAYHNKTLGQPVSWTDAVKGLVVFKDEPTTPNSDNVRVYQSYLPKFGEMVIGAGNKGLSAAMMTDTLVENGWMFYNGEEFLPQEVLLAIQDILDDLGKKSIEGLKMLSVPRARDDRNQRAKRFMLTVAVKELGLISIHLSSGTKAVSGGTEVVSGGIEAFVYGVEPEKIEPLKNWLEVEKRLANETAEFERNFAPGSANHAMRAIHLQAHPPENGINGLFRNLTTLKKERHNASILIRYVDSNGHAGEMSFHPGSQNAYIFTQLQIRRALSGVFSSTIGANGVIEVSAPKTNVVGASKAMTTTLPQFLGFDLTKQKEVASALLEENRQELLEGLKKMAKGLRKSPDQQSLVYHALEILANHGQDHLVSRAMTADRIKGIVENFLHELDVEYNFAVEVEDFRDGKFLVTVTQTDLKPVKLLHSTFSDSYNSDRLRRIFSSNAVSILNINNNDFSVQLLISEAGAVSDNVLPKRRGYRPAWEVGYADNEANAAMVTAEVTRDPDDIYILRIREGDEVLVDLTINDALRAIGDTKESIRLAKEIEQRKPSPSGEIIILKKGLNSQIVPYYFGFDRSFSHKGTWRISQNALPHFEQWLDGLEQDVKRVAPSQAMTHQGGIDLTSRHLNMESSGQKINITFDPAMIAQFKRGDFSGVRIQILDVVPINLMPLLGLKED